MILLLLSASKSLAINLSEFNPDKGVIALMYHRFNENKYPSTNIRNEVFLKHLDEINNSKFEFISFNKFNEIIKNKMEKNYLLLTIDDGFESFYLNAWPVLKKRKIPFILFVSTREVGNYGYMTWKQIKEIESNHGGDDPNSLLEEIRPLVAGSERVLRDGDLEAAAWSCGMVAGLIHDVPTCKELIDTIMQEADEIINQRLKGFANA